MAGSYKVASQPIRARSYENKRGGGNLVVWRLGLEDAQSEASDGLFELHMVEGNNPPGMGEQIEVDRFIQGEFQGEKFVRIKKAYSQDGRSGESYSGGKEKGPGLTWRSAPYERGAEHPRNERRMVHTAALSATPEYYRLLREENFIEKPESKVDALRVLAGITQWLSDSYLSVLDAPGSRPKPPLGVSVDAEGLNSSQTEIPADVPFS